MDCYGATRQMTVRSPFGRGIANLNALLAMLTPNETALLPNYPNPFNPETWIPYRLAEAADVRLPFMIQRHTGASTQVGIPACGVLYRSGKGSLLDGRNDSGESVASGVYLYQLPRGDYYRLTPGW